MNMPSSRVLDLTVPITRFNKGEANKVFDEVKQSGCKIVLKNNTPACVLVSPDKYREIMDEIEEARLYALVAERIESDTGITYPAEEVYERLGIQDDVLDEIPMEYGVDFE